MMMRLIDDHAPRLGVARLCDALGVPRASYYREKRPVHGPHRPRTSPRALSAAERGEILDMLHGPRFVDRAPAEVVAALLDDGSYRCSERTMYRILAASGEVRERRDQLRRPTYVKPELLATRPNELWSWDITKLHGPAKWTYFYLYVILDVFSRYVVGWMVALQESAALAQELIRTTCERQGITAAQLTIHADRGSSMTSKPVALLLADLGVTKTHSRPHTSNDNPFSEAAFKTLKYRPDFPERFGAVEDARRHCAAFFDWYNAEHHHAGIAMLTPHDVHHGLADERTAHRAAVLAAAHRAHPERFVRGAPTPHAPPREVWINPPPRRGDKSPPKASETAPALGAAEAGAGAEEQGLGGAATVACTEEVLH
jgi:putative transposase